MNIKCIKNKVYVTDVSIESFYHLSFLDHLVKDLIGTFKDTLESKKIELYIKYEESDIGWAAKCISDDTKHPIIYLLDICLKYGIWINIHFPKVYYNSIICKSTTDQRKFFEESLGRYVYNNVCSIYSNLNGFYELDGRILKRCATIVKYHNINSYPHLKYLYIINGVSIIINLECDKYGMGEVTEIYNYSTFIHKEVV